MDSHSLILVGAGLLIIWLVFRFIRAVVRLVIIVFIIVLALWFFTPARNFIKEKLGLQSQNYKQH